jgi:hypothetical protein
VPEQDFHSSRVAARGNGTLSRKPRCAVIRCGQITKGCPTRNGLVEKPAREEAVAKPGWRGVVSGNVAHRNAGFLSGATDKNTS